MTLQLLAVVALGLMCGSELNVAAFAHPMLNRQPLDVHVRMRASMAALFGRVMPFWMPGSALLNLLLLLPLRAVERVRIPVRCGRIRDPALRGRVFARRSGANQQQDHQMDSGISS